MTYQEAQNLILSSAWNVDDRDCWIWRRRLNRSGQPVITVEGETEIAARFAYRAWREQGHELEGELRPEVPLLHTCGNRLCCCPWHLKPGMPGQGSPRGKHNRTKGCCRRGHPYDGVNLIRRRCGRRRCRICHAAQARASRSRGLARERAVEELLKDLQRPPWEDGSDSVGPSDLLLGGG